MKTQFLAKTRIEDFASLATLQNGSKNVMLT